MSEKINIYEKLGDFLLNLIQLVVGGIVFAAVMADDSINKAAIYIGAFLAILFFLIVALSYIESVTKRKEKTNASNDSSRKNENKSRIGIFKIYGRNQSKKKLQKRN